MNYLSRRKPDNVTPDTPVVHFKRALGAADADSVEGPSNRNCAPGKNDVAFEEAESWQK
jgi:hypothetical protein